MLEDHFVGGHGVLLSLLLVVTSSTVIARSIATKQSILSFVAGWIASLRSQ
jgi:hypothetical protein